jgi:hypothetical protein
VVAKVREQQAVNKQEAQSLMQRDLIPGSKVRWRSGNIIRLRSQKGFQFWRTEMIART